MIEVAPETACMLYLGLTIIALLVVWLKNNRKSQNKDIVTYSSERIVCEFCHSPYVDDARKGLTRCPQCHFLNKKILKKR